MKKIILGLSLLSIVSCTTSEKNREPNQVTGGVSAAEISHNKASSSEKAILVVTYNLNKQYHNDGLSCATSIYTDKQKPLATLSNKEKPFPRQITFEIDAHAKPILTTACNDLKIYVNATEAEMAFTDKKMDKAVSAFMVDSKGKSTRLPQEQIMFLGNENVMGVKVITFSEDK